MILTACPSKSELRALTIGELAEAESDEIFDHVRDCEQCEQRLVDMDTANDTLIQQLQDDTDDDDFAVEPSCRLAVAKALGSLAASHHSRDVSHTEILPDKIGEYEIVKPIGRGGMSSVYLARHAKLGREVAVKVLSSHRLAEPRTLERFNTEMRMVGSLTHPNIVTAFDAREVDGVTVLVTEFIDGFDVGEIVRRVGRLSVADASQIGVATAKALAYVNEQGMVHRDVKPSNVMISRQGDIKVLDLGLARFHDPNRESADVTATGQAMGTADYIAPEQVNDSRSVDIRADVYALGCTLFKLLSGRAPFEDQEHSTIYAKLNAHVAEAPLSLGDVAPDVPASIVRMVDRMIDKDPETRLTDLERIVDQLEKHLRGCDLCDLIARVASTERGEEKPPTTSERLRPHSKGFLSRRIPFYVAIAAFVGGLLFGLVFGIVIKVQRADGTWFSFTPPDSSHTTIDKDGNVEVQLDGGKAEGGQAGTGKVSAANTELEGVWRVVAAADGPERPRQMVLFYDKFFYLMRDDKPIIVGEFRVGTGDKAIRTFDVDGSIPEKLQYKGIHQFSNDGRRLTLAIGRESRPRDFAETIGVVLVIEAERVELPTDPADLIKFSHDPENYADLGVISAYQSMKMGITPADPNHPAVLKARSSVQMSRSKLNLKQIGLAFHNFHDAYHKFPPSAGTAIGVDNRDDGHPPHSWRVAILPFIGEADLYQEYRLNEPWDSDHNKQLLQKMPRVYRHPNAPEGTTNTSYVGVVGENTGLGQTEGRSMREFTDGTSNTLLILEAKTSIPWTKPADLKMGSGDDFLEGLEIPGLDPERLVYGMTDASVREMKPIDMEELRKLLTINGGEQVRRP